MQHFRISQVIAAPMAAMALLAVSCSQDTRDADGVGQGFISPTVACGELDASQFALTLQSPGTGQSYTWADATQFPATEPFLVGTYRLMATHGSEYEEGWGCPWLQGEATVEVVAGETAYPVVECRRRNVAVSTSFESEAAASFGALSLTLHSEGGSFFSCLPGEHAGEPLYVRSGRADIFAAIEMADGRSVTLLAAKREAPEGATIALHVGGDATKITIEGWGEPIEIAVDEALFAQAPPRVEPVGFTPGVPLLIKEGVAPQTTIAMQARSEAPLAELLLTVVAGNGGEVPMPAETDLLSMPAATRLLLADGGVEVGETEAAGGFIHTVDLTQALAHLKKSDSPVTFTVVAIDRAGRASQPLTLTVAIEDAGIRIRSLEPTLMGSRATAAFVEAPDPEYYRQMSVAVSTDGGETWTASELLTSETVAGEPGLYRLAFTLPESGSGSALLRFCYMQGEVGRLVMRFASPAFSIEADPFAHYIAVKVHPQDASLTASITSMLHIYANGTRLPVMGRAADRGLVWVDGVNPSTDYSITATIFDDPAPAEMSAAVAVHTEDTPDLPNGGFEDIEKVIDYKDLPSGGLYSQNAMPLYTRCNKTSYTVRQPAAPWASVNAKTFYEGSSNPNTWYMQPSTMESADIISGAVSVRLVSVAFDPAGEAIEPYRQLAEPYILYNPNIPYIRYRAAGKLFLGTYSYTPEQGEVYGEGIAFTSRPSALNGVYRFMPGSGSPDDNGMVTVTLMGMVEGREQPIAQGIVKLRAAFTATSFSVPLEYTLFGVKATSLRVMISSSSAAGDIEYESRKVVTTPDAVSATSTGNVLDIDQLTLSY